MTSGRDQSHDQGHGYDYGAAVAQTRRILEEWRRENAEGDPYAELAGTPDVEAPALALANIRRLCERHGVAPADGNGELRSAVAMVEELALRRPR